MTPAKYLIKMVEGAKSDDLFRAKLYFRGMDMNEQFGSTGKTCRQVLAEYEASDQLWKEAKSLLDRLLEEQNVV